MVERRRDQLAIENASDVTIAVSYIKSKVYTTVAITRLLLMLLLLPARCKLSNCELRNLILSRQSLVFRLQIISEIIHAVICVKETSWLKLICNVMKLKGIKSNIYNSFISPNQIKIQNEK